MSPNVEAYQAGIEAAKQKHHLEAIQFLETFCQSCADRHSKDYLQAEMWLVKAYQDSGQIESAIALCQQMAAYENPQISSWAQKILPILSATPHPQPTPAAESESTTNNPQPTPAAESESTANNPQPTPAAESESTAQQPLQLLEIGNHALKEKRYSDAIQALEEYLQLSKETESDEYYQAQMWLIKAYKGNDNLDKAIELCQPLVESSNLLVKSWAQQTLPPLLKKKG